jgi:hypothetical protein
MQLNFSYKRQLQNSNFLVADACKLKIATKQIKCLEKENVNLNTRLHSQVDDLKEYIETIECLQLNIQELSYHTPITHEQLEDM